MAGGRRDAGGVAGVGQNWTLSINPAGAPAEQFSTFAVTADARALSKVVTQWAADFNGLVADGITYHAEAIGRHRRQRQDPAVGHRRQRQPRGLQGRASIGASGSTVVGGTPKQDFGVIFATQWTMAAFEVKTTTVNPATGAVVPRVLAAEDWVLTITDTASTITPLKTFVTTYTVKAPSALAAGVSQISDLTTNLADRAPTDFRPVVSGYQVSFDAPWPAEATSSLVLSGAPVAGTTLDGGAGHRRHRQALQPSGAGWRHAGVDQRGAGGPVNADTAGNLSARAAGVALIIVNTAGNTLDTSFSISPTSTALTPDPVASFAGSVVLAGTPVAGDTWSVTLRHNDGAAFRHHQHDYLVRASVSLAEVATGLAARINAAGHRLWRPPERQHAGHRERRRGRLRGQWPGRRRRHRQRQRQPLGRLADGHPADAVGQCAARRDLERDHAGRRHLQLHRRVAGGHRGQAGRRPSKPHPHAVFVAASEGSTLLLGHRSTPFTVTAGFTPSSASNGSSLAPAAATAWVVQLAGDLVAGETWTIRLGGSDVSVTVLAGDTRSSLARKLADVFNAGASATLRAAADGSVLVLADITGAVFTPLLLVTAPGGGTARGEMLLEAATGHSRALTGSPVQGEVWVVTLTVGGSTVAVGHTVGLVDADNNPGTPRTLESLVDVAAALAAAINGDAQAGFSAFAIGGRLVIVEREGATASSTISLQPAAARASAWCRRCGPRRYRRC
jgi:hypothetical protein